jgi:branched-chain amino acid transport system substrate-binding protein
LARALLATSLAGLGLAAPAGCGDDDDSGRGSSDLSAGDCNRRCQAQNGPHWVCRAGDRQCTNLLSDECTAVVGDDTRDDAVVLGVLNTTTGDAAALGTAYRNSYQLAYDELRGELPPAPGGKARRPLVLVNCTDGGDGATGVKAARHLVDDVQVPGVVGPLFSGVLIRVATEVAVPKGVLVISPTATSDAITDLQDNGLVWRTPPPDSAGLDALVQLASEYEQRPRAGGEAFRLAVVYKGDAFGANLSAALEQRLTLNGAPALDPANANNYVKVDYGDPGNATDNPPRYGVAVDELLRVRPHAIFVVGTSEALNEVIRPVEAGWGSLSPAPAHRPLYQMTDLGFDPAVKDLVGNDGDFRRRVRGLIAGTSSPLYTAFEQAYNARFATDGTTANGFSAGAYDIMYLLAYSIGAAGDQALSGRVLADGLGKLVGGATAVQVGPGAFEDTFARLAGGETFNFEGASGPLDFNVATGEAPSDYQVGCLPKDATGFASGMVASGQYFSAVQSRLVGSVGAVCQ